MKNIKIALLLGLGLLFRHQALAQGPPIRSDKPIMLGAKKGTIRPMYLYADNAGQDFHAMLLMADYNINKDVEIGVELPYVFANGSAHLGDMAFKAKYQFIRIDGMGKTLRIAAKAMQTLASGLDLETPVIGMGSRETYLGIVGAYESLRLGLQGELGYAWFPAASHMEHIAWKMGVGVPVLKPVYPVNQLNLFLEFEGLHMQKHRGEYAFFYAPGIQYARGRCAYELSLQLPIAQNIYFPMRRNMSVLAGFRVVI